MADEMVDMFSGSLTSGRAQQRIKQQTTFESRVTCAVLRAFEAQPGDAKAVIDQLEGDVKVFDLHRMGFPLHLVAVKLTKTVAIYDILKYLMKTPLRTHVEEAFDTFQEEPFALIFASDGDGMQDLVLHTDQNINRYMDDWYTVLPQHRLHMCTLKGFLVAARKLYDKWFPEQ